MNHQIPIEDNLMLKSLVLLGIVLSCTACQTTDLDSAIQKNLPAICKNAELGHLTFQALGEAVSKTSRNREAAIYASLEAICLNPAGQTTASVLISAISTYALLAQQWKKGEGK